MVELLWRLVLKINARAVFLCTVLLLCIALVILFRSGNLHSYTLSQYGQRGTVRAAEPLSPLPQTSAFSTKNIDDPFTSAFLMAWLDLEANREQEREAAKAAAVQALPVKQPVVAPAPRKAEPRKVVPKWMPVRYLGMVSRTDGSRVALVSEVEGGKLSKLSERDTWQIYQVESITADRLTLDAGEGGEDAVLAVGVVGQVRKAASER